MMSQSVRSLLIAATVAAGGLAMVGCTTTSPSDVQASPRATTGSLDAQVDATLSRLYATVSGSRELVARSKAVLVFPTVVGGSFVDVANAAPNDLDIVVFYRARTEVRFEPGRALQRLTRKFLLDHIDMRFVPCDAEPWLLVKLTSYFTMLYQSRRPGTDDRNHGLVLLVPGPGQD